MKEREIQETSPRSSYKLVVAQFLLTWLFFIILLSATALLLNIDWARPQIETLLSQNLNRRIHLGRLSWSLGLNGLAIDADHLSINEMNGKPFLTAGRSEMGVAFLPLINNKLIIRHLVFSRPDISAVRLGDNRWNFSDLIKPEFEIRFIEINDGNLHLRDQTKLANSFSPYEFDYLNLKSVWPKKNHRWPFFLSFRMPSHGYQSEFKLTAFGNGDLGQWQKSKYQFSLHAKKFNPQDFPFLAAFAPQVRGLFDLQLAGTGDLSSGIAGVASANIKNLYLPTTSLGTLQAEDASGQANFVLDLNKMQWHNLVAFAGDVIIRSHGSLSAFHAADSTYDLAVKCRMPDLSKAPPLILPAQAAMPLPFFSDPKHLRGEAFFDVKIQGHSANPKIAADIKAAGLPVAQFRHSGIIKFFPWLANLIERSSANLRGEVRIPDPEHMELPNADVIAGGSSLSFSGLWDQRADMASLKFSGKDIDISLLTKQLKQAGMKFLDDQDKLLCSGHVDLSGALSGGENHGALNMVVALKDVAVKGDGLSTHNLVGGIAYDGSKLLLSKIHGSMGKGQFELEGQFGLSVHAPINVRFHGKSIDLENLKVALQMLKVDFPVLTERQLYGSVDDLVLEATDSAKSPRIAMTASAKDLYYRPHGLTRPLHATAGLVSYSDDKLMLKDVALTMSGSQLIANLEIDHLSTTANLRRIKVASAGVDSNDLHFYLSSSLMPSALRDAYNDYIAANHLSGLHGKLYGNIFWQGKPPGDYELDGLVGFYNLSAHFGAKNWPFSHLSGVVAASGSELLIQDVTGAIGATSFTVNGHVLSYRQANRTWQTEWRAQVYPDELLRLAAGVCDQFQGKIVSNGPIALKALVNSGEAGVYVVTALHVDPADHLRLATPIGQIVQPTDQAISFDGSLTFNPGQAGMLQVNNANLIIGDSIMQTKGKFAWSNPENNSEPAVDFKISTPNPVSAKTLVALVNPLTSQEKVVGRISGELTLKGPLSEVTSRGYVALHQVSLPEYGLYDLTGQIQTPGWSFDGVDLTKSTLSGSMAQMHLDRAKLGELAFSKVNAYLVFEPVPEESGTTRIALKDGSADMGGGTLNIDAWADLTKQKYHFHAQMAKVAADKLASQFLGDADLVSGRASANLDLSSQGADYKELLGNLDGSGSILLEGGRVVSFGPLQEKLTQASLLQGGIFGFNLNNVVQSVVPVRAGNFKNLEAQFRVKSGLVNVDQLRFNGDDMHLMASGIVNLPLNTVAFDVQGNIPRVSTSVLGGAVGEVSRGITLQKLISVLTLHKLESLPALPILGDIASDRPRAFTFKVLAQANNPHLIGQSIQKSFRWLPDRSSNISPHPVSALTAGVR